MVSLWSLHANHLKQAICCPSSDQKNQALHSLTGMVNLLCAGNVPPSVISHLCGALLPCLKKSGDLRPIADREVLHRLTFKSAASAVLPEAIRILSLSKWVLAFLVAEKQSFTLFLKFSRITPSYLNTSTSY